MKNNNKISIIVTVLTVLAFAICVDHAVAQKLSDAQKAADKAQEEASKAADDAKEAQENADLPLNAKSGADKAAEKADQQAEKDAQAARDAQDKADASQAAKDANTPGSSQQAAKDQEAADKAREQAQKSEDAAKKADEKADRDNNPAQKKNRQKQREKRKKAQEAWKKKRELEQLRKQLSISSALRPSGAPTLAALASDGKVKIDSVGTGETIGHVADLKIRNLTDQPLTCAVPPMILESGSGNNQHYACPSGQTVALNPHQTKTVPMNGVCLNRNKPPVGKGVSGDLVINEANPSAPQNPNSHLPPPDVGTLLRICTSKYDAADKLQRDGALKDLPYKDKQKQKDIVVQWSTWTDPRICQVTGAPPATKDDLKKVVYKQLETKGPMSPETKKKVDQGIDTIFEKVELTTAKAKDLEQATGGNVAPGTSFNVSNGTPAPQAQEKPKAETPAPLPQTEERPKLEPECKDECTESDTPRNCEAEVQINIAPADVDPDWLKSVQKAEKEGKKALQAALKKLPGPFKVFGKTYAELLKNMPDYSKIAEGMAKKQGVDVWVMVVCHYEKCEKVPCKKKTKWAWVKHTDENKPHKLTPPDYAALHEGKKAFDPQLKDEKLYDAIAKAIENDEDVKKEKEACEAICK